MRKTCSVCNRVGIPFCGGKIHRPPRCVRCCNEIIQGAVEWWGKLPEEYRASQGNLREFLFEFCTFAPTRKRGKR